MTTPFTSFPIPTTLLDGATVMASGSITPRSLNTRFGEIVNVKDYGARGDGVTNDSSAIQAVINNLSAGNGGFVVFPPGQYLCNLVLQGGVQLIAQSFAQHWNPINAGVYNVILQAASGGALIDTPLGSISTIGVLGFSLIGLGAGTPLIGIHLRNVRRGSILSCDFENFADQAILYEAGLALNVRDCFAQNCLMNRTRSGFDGVFQTVNTTDSFFYNNEVTASTSGKTPGGQCCAWSLNGGTDFVVSCIGEISDIGFYCNTAFNKYLNCRADNNEMEGFHVAGVTNQFANCHALSNGRDAANTYSGFYAETSAQQNVFANCISNSQINTQKYAFEDHSSNNSPFHRNSYVNCFGSNYNIANVFVDPGGDGASFQPLQAWFQTFGQTTYDVTNVGLLDLTGSASPKTITALTNGVPNQVVRIRANANITLQNNANLITNTGANKTLAVNKIYTFTCADNASTFIENA